MVLYDHGHALGRVRAARALSADGRTLTATFTVEEGEVFTVGRIALAGGLPRPEAAILAGMKQRSGATFNHKDLAEDVLRLRTEVRDLGHGLALIEPQVDTRPRQREVDITITVQRGPAVRFGAITITGQTAQRRST